jgi:hypothetical protein
MWPTSTTWFDAADNCHNDAMHVVERFKRTGADLISAGLRPKTRSYLHTNVT